MTIGGDFDFTLVSSTFSLYSKITIKIGETKYDIQLNGTCVVSDSTSTSNKWTLTDANNLGSYANNATTKANDAFKKAVSAMSASATNKVVYNNSAISYVSSAKSYLQQMKSLADSKAVLDLIGENVTENYSTVQEAIDYAIKLCDKIVNIKITSSNYSTYEDQILAVTQDINVQCVAIQAMCYSLIQAFAS